MRPALSCVCLFGSLITLIGCGGSKELKNAKKYIDVREFDKAKELLDLELKSDPKNTEAYLLLGKVDLIVGDIAAASDAFDKAVLIETSAKRRIGSTYFEAAKAVYEARGDSALRAVSMYLDKATTFSPEVGSDVVSWALSIAKKATSTDKTVGPIELLGVAGKLDPDGRAKIGSFCLQTAKTYLEKGSYPEAIGYAVCSGDLSPDNLKAASNVLKAAALMESLPDHQQEVALALGKAVQWNPSLAEDDDVVWVSTVKVAESPSGKAGEYLAKFPNGKHAAEARWLTATDACFVVGSGEHSIESEQPEGYSQLNAMIRAKNPTQAIKLTERVDIPKNCLIVIVAGPKRDYPAPETALIRKYVEGGGRALIMLDGVMHIGKEEPPTENAELVRVLGDWGVTVNKDLVLDLSGVGGILGLPAEVPVVLTYESHPITQPLTRQTTAFPLARSLTTKSGDKTTVSKLFGTTEDSVAVTKIGAGGAIDPKTGTKGPLTLAAAGTYSGATPGRFVVVGTSLWSQNSLLGSRSLANRDLFVNIINWLSAR
jgi:tetratricopeptide (TPR) repeat protein